ncbi:hypothetical protein RIF29_18014 [Crotalaria pallida]|uniref:Uncharacterized protein n=1 Tax=Crotalaria pallida TaxID=3830 RepID=A0AAN9FQ38_CROPI
MYLYPFLETTNRSGPYELLRLASLGVIGALVQKVVDAKVIAFLTSTEVVPLCLHNMEVGCRLSETVEFTDSYLMVATFIVQQILLDNVGLNHVCASAERFFAVTRSLRIMVAALAEKPSLRLLKSIIRCYLRLSEDPRGVDALRSSLPGMLTDGTFISCLRDDPTTRGWLDQLLHNVGPRAGGGRGGLDRLNYMP